MNQDLTGNQYPPPGFQPEGPLTIGGEGGGGNVGPIDAQPTQGSGNAVSSGGVYDALQDRELAIAPQQTDSTDYVWVGNKTWRHLQTWIGQLIAEAAGAVGVRWDDIIGKPVGLITQEADPTVKPWIKSITETQKNALIWFTDKFSRTGNTLGNVLIIGDDGDSVISKPLGELLTNYFPALSTIMSGVVSPPVSLTLQQVISDVKASWIDIERRAGYYQIEFRVLNQDGVYSDWQAVNQPENDITEHTIPSSIIPSGSTRIGGRLRYLDTQNVASAWIETEIVYSSTPVVGQTTYTLLLQEARWYGTPENEIIALLLEEARWYGDTIPDTGTGTGTGGGGGGTVGDAEDYMIVPYEHEFNDHLEPELYNKSDGSLWMRDIGTLSLQTNHYFLNNYADPDDCSVFDEPVIIGKLYQLIKYSIDSYNYERWRTGQGDYPLPNSPEWRDCEQTEVWFSIEPQNNQA